MSRFGSIHRDQRAVTFKDIGAIENTLVLANLYDRGGVWRSRSVAQGYSTGLAALAVLHGVDVED